MNSNYEWLSLIVCVLGLIIYLLVYPPAAPPATPRQVEARQRIIEIGRIMFWVGLLIFLAHRDKVVNLLGR